MTIDVLILGNGFDLAHGLKTKYSDFLNYCKNIENLEVLYGDKQKIKLNLWLAHFINITNQNKIGENWIDLEDEIFNVVEKICNNLKQSNLEDFGKIFNLALKIDNKNNNFCFDDLFVNSQICKNVKEYSIKNHSKKSIKVDIENIKYLSNFLYDQLREFTVLFTNYLNNVALKNLTPDINNRTSKFRIKNINKKIIILNFNYTNIFEYFYQIGWNRGDELRDVFEIETSYIHGNINDTPCNIVLGTKNFDNKVDACFNKFTKHYQRHKYATIEKYQDLLSLIKKIEQKLAFHIIGHSLDSTDRNILKHFLMANTNSTINIYYHDERIQEILMRNINLIIDEEEVMTRVRFISLHDKERGILVKKEED